MGFFLIVPFAKICFAKTPLPSSGMIDAQTLYLSVPRSCRGQALLWQIIGAVLSGAFSPWRMCIAS
jgi:hypothetical protein